MKHGAKPEKSGDAKPPVLTITEDSGAAMNISKGNIMKLILSSVFSALAALSSMPSLAQSETKPISVASSSATQQHILSVVYQNATIEKYTAGTLPVNQIPDFGDETNTALNVNNFRSNGLSMTNSRSSTFIKNDLASFTVNAPAPAVNGALSFLGTVHQSQVDSALTKWIQVLSLVATRKINAEFAYSAKVNQYSSFSSAITCRLHPATDSGKSDVIASVRYGIKF